MYRNPSCSFRYASFAISRCIRVTSGGSIAAPGPILIARSWGNCQLCALSNIEAGVNGWIVPSAIEFVSTQSLSSPHVRNLQLLAFAYVVLC